jgi:hypothetical protein
MLLYLSISQYIRACSLPDAAILADLRSSWRRRPPTSVRHNLPRDKCQVDDKIAVCGVVELERDRQAACLGSYVLPPWEINEPPISVNSVSPALESWCSRR